MFGSLQDGINRVINSMGEFGGGLYGSIIDLFWA